MRFFCADFCADFAPILRRFWHFAPILRRFLTQKVGLRPKSWTSSSLNGKTGNPFIYWEIPIFLGWVPGRTRTVDIQNHKQVVKFIGIPVFIGISAFPLLAFAPILRRISAELYLNITELSQVNIHSSSD